MVSSRWNCNIAHCVNPVEVCNDIENDIYQNLTLICIWWCSVPQYSVAWSISVAKSFIMAHCTVKHYTIICILMSISDIYQFQYHYIFNICRIDTMCYITIWSATYHYRPTWLQEQGSPSQRRVQSRMMTQQNYASILG